MSSCPPPFEDASRGERKKRVGAFTCHGTTARTNAEGRDDVSAGVPPADGSIDRELKISTSALGRAGARPAKVTRGGSAGKRLFGRGVQTGYRGFEGDRGGCLAACASSPHSQLRIYDETTHLEPCCAANSSAASIVTAQPPDSTSQFPDRVLTDRRTFCVRRRLRVTVRRLGPLEGREVSTQHVPLGGAGHARCQAVFEYDTARKMKKFTFLQPSFVKSDAR